MTAMRCARISKSGIAAAVSVSLFLTSAGWPASRAFAAAFHAAPAGESGSAASRAVGAIAAPVSPILALNAVNLGNGAPVSSLLAAPAGHAAVGSPAAVSFAAASAEPATSPAAADPDEENGEASAADSSSASGSDGSESGPRWVKGWIGRQISRWRKAEVRDSRRAFDGDSARAGSPDRDSSIAGIESEGGSPLAKPSGATERIIENHSIPTPDAARRVGEIRRERGTPLWTKIAAPIAVAAAGVVALHFGAVPVLTLAAGLVLSVLAHEVAHLGVLKALGDRTAEHAGSHSLNPFHHIDSVKTVILPAVSLAISSALLPFPLLIGAGKPVDADFNNLRGPLGGPRSARNALWVAAAGPLTNLALAGLALGAAALLPAGGALAAVALGLAKMNAALAVFNLLPLPQLDGGKILASLLPERFYARWVYNPNVEKGYQGMFRRLYEGPANVLTFMANKLGVRSQKNLNRFANGATFAALAAFYAVAYLHFSIAVPLLFLALPCTYDYWCIREKVRSEAAVKEVMEIFSQWSSVIAQIAEDLDMASDVSLFETEHAMKNALETLIDEMMAKEEFRALSDEEKIEALMKAYPDKAAEFLKDKVFTESADTIEKVKELLKDARNTPYYERLRRWLSEHDVFNRWDNPKYEGKLRDQMKEKEQTKANGQRGSTTLGMMLALAALGGAAALFPELVQPLSAAAAGGLGLLGLAGVIDGGDGPARGDWRAKLDSFPGGDHAMVIVQFRKRISRVEAFQAVSRYPGVVTWHEGPTRIALKIPAADARAAAEIARRLGPLDLVEKILVPAAAFDAATGDGTPAPEVPAPAPSAEPAAGPSDEQIAAEIEGRALARMESGVDWKAKVIAVLDEGDEFQLTIDPSLSAPGRERLRRVIRELSFVMRTRQVQDDVIAVQCVGGTEELVKMIEEVASFQAVTAVAAPAAARDRLLAISLPAKISSHGKAHWSAGAVLARFSGEATQEQIKAVLGRLGQARVFRHGDFYTLSAAGADAAAQVARALAEDESVAAVEVHPNAAASLQNRIVMPYPEAATYDPSQAVLVQFKDGATEERMKEYAELRRLHLVYPAFRGMEGLALLEIVLGADAAATRQMLVDETLDEGSIASEVKPFKEQPGSAPLAPSPAARSRAEARKAAQAAVEEAAARQPRRDAQAEWLKYLQTRKLQDGTTLNAKQVQALAEYLKPVAKGPAETRPPVVARSEEVKRILPIVTSPRGMRNSVILVGGAGTGKTAVAEGLAEMIEDAEHASANDAEAFLQFQRLKGRWLVELDINKILSSDEPVKVLNAVLDLLPRFNDPNPGRGNEIIVLMDEIQKIFLDRDGQKIANVLKGPLRDGKIAVIATTTDAEYKKFIESDDAFRRRLEKIAVGEPTVEQSIRILRAIKSWIQQIHDAAISDEALTAAAKLADQFDKTNFNPDKAIKAVQDGAELSRPDNLRAAITLDIRETFNELVVAANEARQILVDKGVASTLALPVELYNRVAELIKRAEALYAAREAVEGGRGRVTIDVVKRVIAQKTGIGSGQLNLAEDDAARYVKMEDEVGGRVVNQEPAIRAIADAIRRNKAGLSNPHRPMGKFLLVGPTGVGKTYLAKELARFLFNDPEAMVRFDMSEFMEEHAAMRLTGAPPSYVGYGEGGQLTEAVRKKPYSVILFDEIEKAHPKVFDLLLQILDDGRLTDGEGRTVDFKNAVILMTSNAGMAAVDGPEFVRRIKAARAAGEAEKAAGIEKEWDAEIDARIAEAIHGRFRPEFLNRLDDGPSAEGASAQDEAKKVKWVRVNRLRQQDMEKIARLQVGEFQRLLADRHDTDLVVDDSVIRFLSEAGYSPLYGARPMTGAIEKNIIDPLARWILAEAASGRKEVRGGLIRVAMQDGRVAFSAEPKPARSLERVAVKDAAASVAAEVFSLIERLAGEGEGEEPSEGLFDKMLRAARPSAAKAEGSSAPARAFLAPDAALAMPEPSAPTSLADKAATASAIKASVAAAEAAGWSPQVREVLAVPAGQVGEGWLKQMIAFAKERAKKAAAPAPELLSAADSGRLRIVVHFDAELTGADKESLAAHFTGEPPASFEAAQQLVDNMNLNGGMTRNHYLLDLYRRLRAVPGARMGYVSGAAARGGRGTDLWLEVRKEEPKPVEERAATQPPAAPAIPHQERETARLRELLMRFIDQSHLSLSEQDGHSIRIAAAEGYARLATSAEADAARALILERGWQDEGGAQVGLSSQWPLAMTAALVLQRFAAPEDAPILEGVLRKADSLGGDAFTPLKTAFILALSQAYRAGGLKFVRESAVRVAQIERGSPLIVQALSRALGFIGYPSDHDEARTDGEGLAALYRRMGKIGELKAEFSDEAAWRQADEARKSAILKMLGSEGEPSEANFEGLRGVLMGRRAAGGRSVSYAAAQAWADLTARARLTGGLSREIDLYLRGRGVSGMDSDWAALLAYVLALENSGRSEDLKALERLMNVSPRDVHYIHEQSYFASPEAWARILVRSGKFAEFARPRLGPDGAPRPSILQEMLASKDRPLLTAAAIRALALARDPSFKEKPVEPAGEAPGLRPDR